jgi:hypothetical protein
MVRAVGHGVAPERWGNPLKPNKRGEARSVADDSEWLRIIGNSALLTGLRGPLS